MTLELLPSQELIKARICAALEAPDEDWLEHACRVIAAHVNQLRFKRIYDVSTIGGRVRAARALAGMGQAELARRVKLPQQKISAIERDLQDIPRHKVVGVAMSLGVKVPWLLLGGPEGGPATQGSVLRAKETPKALRASVKAAKLAEARALASAKNRNRVKSDTGVLTS